MDIKRKEDKPMVIHTKEKTRLHMKAAPETKIKGRNVLTVQRGPKIAGERENAAPDKKRDMRTVKNGRVQMIARGKQTAGGGLAVKCSRSGPKPDNKGKTEISPVAEEKRLSAQYEKRQKDTEKVREKRNGTLGTAAYVGTRTALDQMEGGNEIYDAYMVMESLARPATSATDAGRNLFRKQQAAKVSSSFGIILI